MARLQDLCGRRFGKWSVLSKADRRKGETYWLCRCDCGFSCSVCAKNLVRGTSSQCFSCSHETHGKSRIGLAEYNTWTSMMERCSNPRCRKYHNYGGRGISVCDRWSQFECFLQDMGRRPTSKHSLDRINNDGNYEPGNCRWATAEEQLLNRRNTVRISAFGMRLTVKEWSKRSSIPEGMIRGRLYKGWPGDAAVSLPKRARVSLYPVKIVEVTKGRSV